MNVMNKDFQKENPPNKGLFKVLLMFVMCIMMTSGFILLSGNTIAKAWNCQDSAASRANHPNGHSFSTSGYCPGQSVRCSNWNSNGTKHCSATTSGTGSHSWSSATCTSPKTCSKCGSTTGSSLGHGSFSYSQPNGDKHKKTCGRSGCSWSTQETHSFSSATCTSPATCVCGATSGSALGHSDDGNGTGKCVRCGQCVYKANNGSHNWSYVSQGASGHTMQCGTCKLWYNNEANKIWSHSLQTTSSNQYCTKCNYVKNTVSAGACCKTGYCYYRGSASNGNAASCGCGSKSTASQCKVASASDMPFDSASKKFSFSGCRGHSCYDMSSPVISGTSRDVIQHIPALGSTYGWHDTKYNCLTLTTPVTKYEYNFACAYCQGGHGASRESQGTTATTESVTYETKWTYKENWQHKKYQVEQCSVCRRIQEVNPTTENCNGSWTSINDSEHKRTCSVCGHTETKPHSFSGWSKDSNGSTHSKTCSVCSKKITNACTNTPKDLTGSGAWSDYSSTQHRRGATQSYNNCPQCGRTKASTSTYEYGNHNSSGVNTASSWSQSTTHHWKTTSLYCNVYSCNHSMGAGSNVSYGPHSYGTKSYGAWTLGASKSTRTWSASCTTCSYPTSGTEDCTHPSYGSAYDYSAWSKGATKSTRTYKQKCSTCGYIKTVTEECTHPTYNSAYGHSGWTLGEAKSTRSYKQDCATCGYTKTVTEECNHSGHIKYSQITGNDSYHKKECTYCTWSKTNDSHNYGAYTGWSQGDATNHTRTKTCSLCSYVYTDKQAHNKSTKSDYTGYEQIANNKTQHNALYNLSCSVCSRVMETSKKELQNHAYSSWGDWQQGDATNHKRTRKCSKCNYVDTDLQAHNEDKKSAISRYEQIAGNDNKHNAFWSLSCTVCGRVMKTDNAKDGSGNYYTTIYKQENHDYEPWGIGTATQHTRKCKKCGYVQKQNHNRNTSLKSNGYTKYEKITGNDTQHYSYWDMECSVCGRNMKTGTDSRELKNHEWDTWSAYNTSDDIVHKRTRTCKLCGYVYTETENHNWTGYKNNPSGNNEVDTCTICDKKRYRNHNLVTTWNTTTHTDTCTTCTYTSTNPHTYSPWEDDGNSGGVDDPDLTKGTHSRHCTYSRCTYDENQPANRKSHIFTITVTDRPGYTKYICAVPTSQGASNCHCVKYQINSYKVNFDNNGGTSTAVSGQTYKYTDGIALPDATRTGYKFKGWQVYSGSASEPNITNTNPLTNGNTKYHKLLTTKLTTDNNSTVTLVAIWEHSHPSATVGTISINGAFKESNTQYYCLPTSDYSIVQTIDNKESVYYKNYYGITVINNNGSIQIDDKDVYNDTPYTTSNEFTGHTLASKAKIKPNGILDGRLVLQPYNRCECTWYDAHTSSCGNTQTITDAEINMYFDGNAPIENGMTELYDEYVNVLDYNFGAIDGRTINVTATENIGSWYSGLTDTCEVKIQNINNPSYSQIISATNSEIDGTRIGKKTYSFTINESQPLYKDGFTVSIKFIDRAGNTTTNTFLFTNFNLRLDDFGSWTYQMAGTSFKRGEAVYAKLTTNNYAESLTIKLPDEWAGVRYLLYQNKDMGYIIDNSIVENLQTASGSIVTSIDQSNADSEIYIIFLIPENTTLSAGQFNAIGKKGPQTKNVSQNFTIGSETITDGLHTVINQTK